METRLFDYTLYDLPNSSEEDFSIEGNGDSGHYIILKREDFSEENRALLSKILEAIQLSLADTKIVIVNTDKTISLSKIAADNPCKTVLSFGLTSRQVGYKPLFTHYRTYQLESQKLLFNDPLSQISEDVALKKKLWTELKTNFIP